jgi:hypothetical protein
MTKPSQPLRSHQARLFETPPVEHDPRRLIKACVRSEYPWTRVARDVLQDMLDDVNKFGRLSTPQLRLLLVYARRAGVGP